MTEPKNEKLDFRPLKVVSLVVVFTLYFPLALKEKKMKRINCLLFSCRERINRVKSKRNRYNR